MVVDHEDTTEPQHDDNHDGAQELRHRVGGRLTDVHPHDVVAIGGVDAVETTIHLTLCTEGLDDTQTTERLLHLTHRIAPQTLGLDALGLQLTTYPTHEPAHDGHDDEGEEGQFPRDEDQGGEVTHDQDRVLEQHLERRHDGVLDLLHITTHTGDDVTLAFLGEETQWQGGDLLVELVADVAHHTSTDRDDRGC